MAADVLSRAGARVVVYERMPSVGRKLLMAGRGGLNLTHSENLEAFMSRYGSAAEKLAPMLTAFSQRDLMAWAEALGEETFIGSSGRVFPRAMKTSPLLRKWLARLTERGVQIRTRMHWIGWDQAGRLRFQCRDGVIETVEADASLLALGGASWPKLGGDGGWREVLIARGIAVSPLQPANGGFDAAWSDAFRARFAGQALKTIALRFGEHGTRGEAMVTDYGLEGGAVYALSPVLRGALARGEPISVEIDLRPDLTHAEIEAKLARAKRGDSLASTLRKTLGLAPVAINLLREGGASAKGANPSRRADQGRACALDRAARRGPRHLHRWRGGLVKHR